MSSRNPRKTTVGLFFGGRSVEHDVSIVTAHQILRALNRDPYEVVPVYITRDGRWLTGEPLLQLDAFKEGDIQQRDGVVDVILSPDVRHHGLLINPTAGRFQRSTVKRLDVAFPAIHGSHGEDGTLQGLLELADIPYVGFATLGSALTNDKIITKQLLQQHGIPVVEGVTVTRTQWLADPDAVVMRIRDTLGNDPVFVKPATLGSSIGVTRADDEVFLRAGLDIATNFDRRVLVEKAITGGIEINIALMGYGDDLQVSVLEQPLAWSQDEFLNFEDKYMRGDEGMKSADRIIPAPISAELAQQITETAKRAFRAVDGQGIVRIDFLARPEENLYFLNELNTMPGSLALYLWQETNLSASEVCDHLIGYARDAHAEKRRNVYDYETNLVALAVGRGTKGAKGTKARRTETEHN